MHAMHFHFLLAYREFRKEFEDHATSDVYRRDLLGLWMAGGEL